MSPAGKKQASTLPPGEIPENVEASTEGMSLFEKLFRGIVDPVLLHRISEENAQPGRIVMCNDPAMELTGYSREELLGMDITDLGHKAGGLEDNEIAIQLQKGKQVLFERMILRKNRSLIPVEIHAREIDLNGEKMVLALLRDVTERKINEEETRLHLMFEQILSKISSRFVNIPDQEIDKGIEKTLKEIGEFLGAVRGSVMLLSPDKKKLETSHAWTADHSPGTAKAWEDFPNAASDYYVSRLRKLEDFILDSVSDLPAGAKAEGEWFKKHGFNPVFFVPIISEDKLVGALGFFAEDNGKHVWPGHFGYLLRYTATIFLNALSRKEISEKLRLTQFTMDRNSEAVFWLSTPGYHVIDLNPAACRSLGYSRKELIGKSVYDFDPVFRDDDGSVLRQLHEKESLTFESVHRTKKGGEFPVEIIANLLVFEGREYLVSFARNISARKEAEVLLRKSEQEYRKLFENVADIFYEASLEGKLLKVTPSVERITEYRQKELIGRPMEFFYYSPELRPVVLKSLHEKGEILDYEINVRDKDGSPIPCLLSCRLIYNEEGKPERILGSITDMRQRRKAESQIRQLSTALQQSPVSVIITDPDTRIVYVNDSFVNFTGMQPEELMGSTPDELTGGQVPLNEYKDLWESVKQGDVWKGEFEYEKKDGDRVWLSITVSPVFDEQNRASNYVAILEEVTERKLAEQNLRKAKEQAEKSDYLKSAFLANMSHEIRTPMNAILGFSTLLKDGGLDKEQSEYYIDIINSKGRDLLRIISDIIDISRIEAGDLLIRAESVEVHPFMRGVYEEFREDTQFRNRRNLQFRLKLPDPEERILVQTDPSRLKQVLVNLIQNALKFTHEGFVELGLKVTKDVAHFYVRDSGQGIPQDKLKIIFERFRQVDDSHTREYGGTGLGLSICKNLLELMGSELYVKSVEGQGSEFGFNLRYTRSPSEVAAGPEEGKEPALPELDMKDKSILIVEDDGSSYLFLETLLKRYSPEILWAKSGKQAIEMVRKDKKIDLVLMDIRMPEMDGIECTRLIRKDHPDLPIIAQTAYAQVTDRDNAIECGCNDYLSKPIAPHDLICLLAKYLQPA